MQLKMNNSLFQNQQLTLLQRNNPLSKATIITSNSKFKINNGGRFNVSIKTNSIKGMNTKQSNTSKVYSMLKREEECLVKASNTVKDVKTMMMNEFEKTEKIESFEELTHGMDSKLSKEDLEKLKTEYDKKLAYDKKGDTKLANEAMHRFDTLIKSKFTDRELDDLDFQRFKKDVTGEFDKKDIQNLEKFRNQALSFEEKGDYKSADKNWAKFDSIIERYDSHLESMDEPEPMDMEADGKGTLANDSKKTLTPKISKYLSKLKEQMKLLKILTNQKKKTKKNKSFQFNDKITYLNKIEKNGLKSVKPQELINFLGKTQKVIDHALENVNVQKKHMESTFRNSRRNFSEKSPIIDLYI